MRGRQRASDSTSHIRQTVAGFAKTISARNDQFHIVSHYNSSCGSPIQRGDQPSDWSVGRQSTAAGQWQTSHHALSNRPLPALCEFNSTNHNKRPRGVFRMGSRTPAGNAGRLLADAKPWFSAGRRETVRRGRKTKMNTMLL